MEEKYALENVGLGRLFNPLYVLIDCLSAVVVVNGYGILPRADETLLWWPPRPIL